MNVTGIILAGGSGERLKSVTRDKTTLRIGGGRLINWSVSTFTRSEIFSDLIMVYRDYEQENMLHEELNSQVKHSLHKTWVQGGARRQDSVLNALEAVREGTDYVFIHDGARPFVTENDLRNLLKAVEKTGAASLARPVTDTIKRAGVAGTLDNLQLEDLQRNRLYAMETPQAFRFTDIREAYRNVQRAGLTVTDCVAAYSYEPRPVTLVESEQNNFKITTPADVELANFLILTGSIKKVFELGY